MALEKEKPSPMTNPPIARDLASQYIAAGDPLGWFEALYAQAHNDASPIPWADLHPNPNLIDWMEKHPGLISRGSALVVGCGLGDDAEHLAARGFRTTAFDISPSAIAWCQRRFPNSPVRYEVHNALNPHDKWQRAFDFIFEAYTLQALPPDLRQQAMHQIANFLAPGGMLLLIARARDEHEPAGQTPWPLTRTDLSTFTTLGLVVEEFEDYFENEDPPVRRFRVVYRQNASGGL